MVPPLRGVPLVKQKLPMNSYDNTLKIKDALQIYFSKYHFPNGGYHLKWFKIKVGMLYIPFPNTKARIVAVKLHDIHHIITGYEANLKGEAEIGAWEIASGCGNYLIAWILNFGAFFYGMFLFPRFLFRAFMRGRLSKTNLYYNTRYDETLLNKTVGELRQEFEPNSTGKNSYTDHLLFISCCLFSLSSAFIFFYILYQLYELIF